MSKQIVNIIFTLCKTEVLSKLHDLSIQTMKMKLIHVLINRRDVPVGVPLDLSTPTGMSCIGTYGKNCKSDSVSKYCVLLVAFQLL